MLRQLLVGSIVLIGLSVTSMGDTKSINDENQILKLKLEVFELKEKNSKLREVIKKFNSETNEERLHQEAIIKLKRELQMSRRAEPLVLLR